jgi:hypothetical protein
VWRDIHHLPNDILESAMNDGAKGAELCVLAIFPELPMFPVNFPRATSSAGWPVAAESHVLAIFPEETWFPDIIVAFLSRGGPFWH